MATIVVLATGGTIAGRATSAGDAVAYQAAQIGAQDLLHSVAGLPELLGGDTLELEQLAQINSKDMTFAVWQRLALRCAHWLDQPGGRAVVITHGTDTLEESAFFLQQVLACAPQAPAWQGKAVILTCAMRPATARLADGPQNLADAIALAQNQQTHGVLVVAAGRVHAATDVQKIHPYRLNAFSSGDAGPLAYMEEGQARWVRPLPGWPQPSSAQQAHALWQALVHTPPAQWPWVEVLHSHAGAHARALQALAQAGVQGVILAATGNGTLHQELEQAAQVCMTQGLPVLLAARCTASAIVRGPASPPEPVPLALPACSKGVADLASPATVLPPSKARILLMLQILAQAGTMPPVSTPGS